MFYPGRSGPTLERVLAVLDNVRRAGDGFQASCPAHDDKSPSLSVRLGRSGTVLVYDHAGCSSEAVIAAIRQRGGWPSRSTSVDPPHVAERHLLAEVRAKQKAEQKDRGASRIDYVRRQWLGTSEMSGLAQRYLTGRGIQHDPDPDTLRSHPSATHFVNIQTLAIVAAARLVDGSLVGTQTIHLSSDGAKKADLQPAKVTRGLLTTAAVHLAPFGRTHLLGEGIETTLSAMQIHGLPGSAALSAQRLRNVALSDTVQEVVLLVDNDVSGTGQREARKAAEHFADQGKRAYLLPPPEKYGDWNDVLMAQVRR